MAQFDRSLLEVERQRLAKLEELFNQHEQVEQQITVLLKPGSDRPGLIIPPHETAPDLTGNGNGHRQRPLAALLVDLMTKDGNKPLPAADWADRAITAGYKSKCKTPAAWRATVYNLLKTDGRFKKNKKRGKKFVSFNMPV